MSKFNRNQIDFRIESLKLTLDGLSQSLKKLRSKHEESDCSDGIWLLEISEPIIGSAFISLQNYINSSIYDRFETLDKQYEKYKLGNIKKQSFTEIWNSEQRKKAYEKINFKDCIPLCRCNTFNQILWELKKPADHVNFLR